MNSLLTYAVVGVATGCIYSLTAMGLVVTYQTSGIFNFAHGAIGMIMAFTFWELTVKDGWPQWLALIVVLGVFAPLCGALIERLLMRGLQQERISTQLVVTLGLLLALIAAATWRWSPTEPRVLPQFFEGHSVRIANVNVTYHQLTMVFVALLVAAFLGLFFKKTRIGIAMRAVVDDPELASLNGADPDMVSAASWALGSSLAGLAGILLAPLVTLDVLLLTLLVITAYAAAMVGRLRDLRLTFVGGIAIGLVESFTVGKLPTDWISKVKPALPILFLYAVLLLMPQVRLKAGRVVSPHRIPRVASRRESVAGAIALVVFGIFAANLLSGSWLTVAGQGLVYGIIMLSLVLLVGYAGQVSACQMTFVGLGAFAMGKWFGGGSLVGIVLAALIAGAVGAIASLPALRLEGLYLALSTLAFALLGSVLFFQNEHVFGYGGRMAVHRPSVLGFSFNSDGRFFVLLCVVFALFAMLVLAIRRGTFGRKLVAMKDSSAACATLGMNLTFTKVAVFAVASAMAGVGGAMFGGLRGQVGPDDFQMLNSLVLLLLVSIAGINTVTGAFMGGMTFGMFPKFLEWMPKSWPRNLPQLGVGLGAFGLRRNPNGWTSDPGMAPIGALVRRVLRVDRPGDDVIDLRPGDVPAAAQEEVRQLAGTAS